MRRLASIAALVLLLGQAGCVMSPRFARDLTHVALATAVVATHVALVASHDAHYHAHGCHPHRWRDGRVVYYYGGQWEYYDRGDWYYYVD